MANDVVWYASSKLALMMFANMLHDKYHRGTGIAFSSIYPGCIAESPLFREKVSAPLTPFNTARAANSLTIP